MKFVLSELTKAGESEIDMGASSVYVACPLKSYHNCSNVVNPLSKPKVEFAVKVADEPSDGTCNEYSSLREPIGRIASSAILWTLEPGVRESINELICFACCTAEASPEPRPTTSLSNLSV